MAVATALMKAPAPPPVKLGMVAGAGGLTVGTLINNAPQAIGGGSVSDYLAGGISSLLGHKSSLPAFSVDELQMMKGQAQQQQQQSSPPFKIDTQADQNAWDNYQAEAQSNPELAKLNFTNYQNSKNIGTSNPGGASAMKTYITYVLKNGNGDVVYVGRASGKGSAAQVMKQRIAKGHTVFDQNPGLTPEVIDEQSTTDANKGAEQLWYQFYLNQGASLLNDPKTPPLSQKPSKLPRTQQRINKYMQEDSESTD